ncbi:MAG TPA: hypothetical protein VIS48_13305 [Candidatus Kryptonia bacterium]
MCSWNAEKGPLGRHRRGWWFLLGLPFVLFFLAVGSLIVMLLWNALLPVLFGLKTIDYLQAIGLLVLAKILFGGFGRRPRPFYGRHRHWDQWRRWHEHDSDDEAGGAAKEDKSS